LALVVDWVLVGYIAAVVISFRSGALGIGSAGSFSDNLRIGFERPVFFFFYSWLMIALAGGQTVGKMVFKIRIVAVGGERVGLGRSALRSGVSLVSALVAGLGYFWAIWDPEHRTWHDMVAETRPLSVSKFPWS